MHQLSMKQALNIWSELEEAYFDNNSYGGDTAEIYMYRFLPYRPGNYGSIEDALSSPIFGEDIRNEYIQATRDLYDILCYFAEMRNVRIEVDGRELGPWLCDAFETHRVHVKIIHKES